MLSNNVSHPGTDMKSCSTYEENDVALKEIFIRENGSITRFLDSIFGFIARHEQSILLNCSGGITFEHLLSQAINKWRKRVSHPQTDPVVTDAAQQVVDPHSSEAEGDLCCGEVAQEVTVSSNDPVSNDQSAVSNSQTGGHEAVGLSNGEELYHWSQTIEDVDVRVPVPSHIVKGKQVEVSIQNSRVSIAIRGSHQQLLEGSLHQPVEANESLWDLTPGEHITLHLTKKEAAWWGCPNPVVGVPGRVEGATEAERPYHSLPADEQADIGRIMFDAEQKALGKPTSNEKKVEGMLRDAWDAEGSPFRGQPFDLSAVNIVPQQQ